MIMMITIIHGATVEKVKFSKLLCEAQQCVIPAGDEKNKPPSFHHHQFLQSILTSCISI